MLCSDILQFSQICNSYKYVSCHVPGRTEDARAGLWGNVGTSTKSKELGQETKGITQYQKKTLKLTLWNRSEQRHSWEQHQ